MTLFLFSTSLVTFGLGNLFLQEIVDTNFMTWKKDIFEYKIGKYETSCNLTILKQDGDNVIRVAILDYQINLCGFVEKLLILEVSLPVYFHAKCAFVLPV